MERTIRVVSPDDAAELLALYRPYVEDTAISFEWETPTLEEFTARIRRTLTKYPYLVLEQAGELLGYAYLSPFHTRAAYAWGAETTIYLRRDSLGQGVGQKPSTPPWRPWPNPSTSAASTPASVCPGARTPISPTTAGSSTPTWATARSGSSKPAAINSAAGTTWSGWRNGWRRGRAPPAGDSLPPAGPGGPGPAGHPILKEAPLWQ